MKKPKHMLFFDARQHPVMVYWSDTSIKGNVAIIPLLHAIKQFETENSNPVTVERLAKELSRHSTRLFNHAKRLKELL